MSKINEVKENRFVANVRIGNLSGEIGTVMKNQWEILM